MTNVLTELIIKISISLFNFMLFKIITLGWFFRLTLNTSLGLEYKIFNFIKLLW